MSTIRALEFVRLSHGHRSGSLLARAVAKITAATSLSPLGCGERRSHEHVLELNDLEGADEIKLPFFCNNNRQ